MIAYVALGEPARFSKSLLIVPVRVITSPMAEVTELIFVEIVPSYALKEAKIVIRVFVPKKKLVLSEVIFPLAMLSRATANPHSIVFTLSTNFPDWVIPGILAAIANARINKRNTAGQISSHLVYKMSSSFLQHLDGQHPGQVQQQQRQVQRARPKTNPITKGRT